MPTPCCYPPFQGFCRDLHSEAVEQRLRSITPFSLHPILRAEFLLHRKRDQANPTPGNIGADFNRLGLAFWNQVGARRRLDDARGTHIEDLNSWRNPLRSGHGDIE